MRVLATSVLMLWPSVVLAQDGLTGTQTNATPRVMVIFDNSRSMEARPDDDFDSTYYADDLDPASLTNGVCDPTNPPADCRNKFCIGKCVMHNVLDPYESLMEVGFASYYQYLRKTTSTVSSSGPRTMCRYDVIAGPGERVGSNQLTDPTSTSNNRIVWSLESNLADPGKCTITNATTSAYQNSTYDSGRACQPTAGLPEPAKTCVSLSLSSPDEWFQRSDLEHQRYSPYMPPPGVNQSPSNGTLLNPARPYQTTTCNSSLTSCSTNTTGFTLSSSPQVSKVTFSSYGPANGKDYYLFETRPDPESSAYRDKFEVASTTMCPAIGTQQHFWGAPSGATNSYNWSSCTSTNPCWMTLFETGTDYAEYDYWYQDKGATYNGWTKTGSNTSTVYTNWGSNSSLSCPSNRTDTSGNGCSSSKPCDLTNGTRLTSTSTDSITSSSPDPQTINGVTYTLSNTSVQTINQDVPGNTASVCGSSYNGYSFQSATLNSGEPASMNCVYSRTVYTLSATTTTYYCRYTKTTYNYARGTKYLCRYQRTVYKWRPQMYKYRWETVGGEVLGDVTITGVTGSNECGGTTYADPLSTGCPAESTTVHPYCSAPGRTCKLRWRSSVSPTHTSYSKGRVTNYLNSSSTSSPIYCRAADYNNSPTAAPGAGSNKSHWCYYTTGSQTQTHEDTFVMSDPYSPTVNPNNSTLQVGSTFVLGGTVNSVQYSLDGNTWTSSPPLSQKVAGWSRTPLASGGQAAMSFVPISPNTLPTIRKIMELRGPDNALGLVMPTRRMAHRQTGAMVNVTGHNTPLYGALTNAKQYLEQEVLPADNKAQCRTYSVILVTDGDENQQAPQPQHPNQNAFNQYSQADLVNAITGLRNAAAGATKPKGGVKTYVVGFGSSFTSGALDSMAVAAGTAVNGKAYNATSPGQLQTQLQTIFNSIAENRYTRSKPVLTYSGERVYVGAFRISGDSREWTGELNAYDINAQTGVNTTPAWEFQKKLDNTQSASSRRVYTHVSGTGLFDINNMNATQSNALYTSMGVSAAEGAQVVNFVLNPNRNAQFQGTPVAVKDSRLSDIFHSTPVLVGPPPFKREWAGPAADDMTGYDAFKAAHANRPERLYVGSNTGMVHAICENNSGAANPDCGNSNAGVGSEVYAFVPPSVLPRLNSTRSTHTYTVDGSFGVADVCLNSTCDTAAKWSSLLLGSMHKGGNRIFALDVTNANSPQFKWEFTDGVLGETWSPPTVVRAKVNMSGGGTDRWVGIMGGGYLSPQNDNSDISNSVVVVDLHTGTVQEDNTTPPNNPARFARYRVDSNPLSCVTDPSSCVLPRNSVPGRVAVARDSEAAYVKYAFVGDTQGRMWSMDFRTPQVLAWRPTLMFDPSRSECATDPSGVQTPIYDATVDSSAAGAPTVGTLPFANPTDPRPMYQRLFTITDTEGRAMVFGGTGSVHDPAWVGPDNSASSYDYFYAVRHTGAATVCSGAPLWVKRFRKGEKVLSEGTAGSGVVFVPSYMPPSGNADVCSARGDGRIYAFYQSTGKPAKVFDPDSDPANNNSTNTLDLPNEGMVSDLVYIPDPNDPSKGKLVFATDTGEPRGQAVTGLTPGISVRGWRRVR